MTAGTAAAGLLWATVLAQSPSRRQHPIRRAVWYALLLLAAIGTLDLTGAGTGLDRAVGLPNADELAQHLLAVLAVTEGRYCAVSILGARGERGRLPAARLAVLPAAVAAALTILFAVSPARARPTDLARYSDFPMEYAAHPAVLAYWVIFAAYLGTTFVIIGRLTWRYGRAAGRTPVGSGLLLVAGGMAAGICYVAYGTAVVAARAAGAAGPFAGAEPALIQALFGALVAGVAAGCLVPAAPHLPFVRGAALYWSLRRLYPLWKGLCEAVPGIALDPVPAWADRLDPRDLRMRLYRRVIEIRDGYLALSPVDVPGLEDTVRAVAARRRASAAGQPILVTATRLELGRRAALRGERDGPAGPADAIGEFGAGTDLDSEVRLLRTIAAHRAMIGRAADRIERETGGQAGRGR